jgi:hypothetical protein
VSPGAARGVERDADGKPVKDLAHNRLLDLKELVRLIVVPRRPTVIAVARGDRARLGPSAERVRSFEQLPDLAKSRKGELAVVRTGERAQKGDALQSKEVRQRMLIDGAIFVAGTGARLLVVIILLRHSHHGNVAAPYGEGTLRVDRFGKALTRFVRPATVISESPNEESHQAIRSALFSAAGQRASRCSSTRSASSSRPRVRKN